MGFRGYVRFVDSEGVHSFVWVRTDSITSRARRHGEKIAAGLNHAVMITEEGAAYAWGANTCGQTGTGNFDATMRPVRILTDVVVDDVAVGANTRWRWPGTEDSSRSGVTAEARSEGTRAR